MSNEATAIVELTNAARHTPRNITARLRDILDNDTECNEWRQLILGIHGHARLKELVLELEEALRRAPPDEHS